MRWIDALKKWNTGGCCWCVPRKGTDCYQEVRGLMPEKKLKAEHPEQKAAMSQGIPLKEALRKRALRRKEKDAPLKIPMEPQRKAMSDSMAPKGKFVEPVPAKKAESAEQRAEMREALVSFGQWVWRRFDGGEIDGTKYKTYHNSGAPYSGGAQFQIEDVKRRYPGYWEEWKSIEGRRISTPRITIYVESSTTGKRSQIRILNLLDQNGEMPSNMANVNRAFVEECRDWMNADWNPKVILPMVDGIRID